MSLNTKIKLATEWEIDFKFSDIKPNPNQAKASEIDFERFSRVFMQSDENMVTTGFSFVNDGKPIIIPEFDPCLLYYIAAENSFERIVELKRALFKNYGVQGVSANAEIFIELFPLTSSFSINLYCAIEAFNNSIIPSEFTFRQGKKVLNRERIQRYFDFESKSKKVVPMIFKKSFPKEYPTKFQVLLDLKDARDQIIHTKNVSAGYPAQYHPTYKKPVELDHEHLLKIVKQYVNFYKPNWIESIES